MLGQFIIQLLALLCLATYFYAVMQKSCYDLLSVMIKALFISSALEVIHIVMSSFLSFFFYSVLSV